MLYTIVDQTGYIFVPNWNIIRIFVRNSERYLLPIDTMTSKSKAQHKEKEKPPVEVPVLEEKEIIPGKFYEQDWYWRLTLNVVR